MDIGNLGSPALVDRIGPLERLHLEITPERNSDESGIRDQPVKGGT